MRTDPIDKTAPSSVLDPRVYVSICDAWVPQSVADRMLPLILEAVAAGKTPKTAAEEIDARLRADLGPAWIGTGAMIERGVRSVRASQRAGRAARRVGPALMRLTPASLRPFLARINRPLARYLAASKYRRKYGGRFVSKIHDEDDLLHYGLDVAGAEQAFRYYRAVRSYYEGGDWNVAEIEKVLGEVGFSLGEAGSFLEFASGYGRLTRHFVHRLSPSKITVSDIDARAVEFLREEFGVSGFYSAPRAEQVTHEGRYDLIVVVSLFSHLPIEHWGPWLERLNKMLKPEGLLLFSVGGMHAWNVNVNDTDRVAFQTKADGFLYRGTNETRGRLDTDDYGIAYVTEGYVERAVAAHFAGRLISSRPQALNGFQDVYVLRRADGLN